MDWIKKLPFSLDCIKKYRYVILIIIIGVVLMLIPSKKQSQSNSVNSDLTANQISLQDQLAAVLSLVDGAGEVRVILTLSDGAETVYQTDGEHTATDTNKSNTVTVTDAQRNQSGLIKQVNPPKYLGAIVVSEGGDRPNVRLAIAEAVSKATGLGLDRISVLKMK